MSSATSGKYTLLCAQYLYIFRCANYVNPYNCMLFDKMYNSNLLLLWCLLQLKLSNILIVRFLYKSSKDTRKVLQHDETKIEISFNGILLTKGDKDSFSVWFMWFKHRPILNDFCTWWWLLKLHDYIQLLQRILNWKFLFTDAERAERPWTPITEENATTTRKLADGDRCLSYQQIEYILCLNTPTIRSIQHDYLLMKKLCWLKVTIDWLRSRWHEV